MASYIGQVRIGETTYPVASSLYGICNSAADADEKVVSCADFDQLIAGVTVHVKFLHTNSSSNATMNINSTGAKPIYRFGTTSPASGESESWKAGSVVTFTYDGTAWHMNGWLNDSIRYNTTAGWRGNASFVPAAGEIIVYTDKATYDENGQTVTVPGIKVGDGSSYGIDLPFLGDLELNEVRQRLNTHVSDTDIHITAAERIFWTNKLNCFIAGENLAFDRN